MLDNMSKIKEALESIRMMDPAEEDGGVSSDPRTKAIRELLSELKYPSTAPRLQFQSKATSMWYDNPKAAGTVCAVRMLGVGELPTLYELDGPESDCK